MSRRLIIFDLDGTLLNTLGDLTQAVNHALHECGFSIRYSEDEIRGFVGNGIGKLLERSLPVPSRDECTLSRMRESFIRFYDHHNAELTKPYPGVIGGLSRLKGLGMILAVASNKYQEATELLVRHYFPDISFACVYGQRPNVPVKPHPQVVFDILQENQLMPDEVLYVGDSGVDMQTAINAGVDAIGVSWGFRSREELASFHPMAVIDVFSDLLGYI